MTRREDSIVRASRQRDSQRQRAAVRRFMAEHGLKPAPWARAAGLPTANVLYAYLNEQTEFLSQPTLEALARAAQVAVSELLGEAQTATQLRMLPIRDEARAGLWRPGLGLSHPTDIEVPIPPSVEADEVVHLSDDHATEVYPAGSYLAVQYYASLRRPLLPGNRVLVHCVRQGRHELTVREIRVHKAGAELILRSVTSVKGNDPLPLPWPYDGRVWEHAGHRCQVRGCITMMMMLRIEANE